MVGTYFSDLIAAADDKLTEQSRLTERMFMTKKKEISSLISAVIHIEKEGKTHLLHQEKRTSKLKELLSNCSVYKYRRRRHECTWLTYSRLDFCAATEMLPQLKKKTSTGRQ